jgi:hypothetical protein
VTTAVLTPTTTATGQAVAGKLWRKQVLPVDESITYTDGTGAKRTLAFDAGYLAKMVQAFNDGAYDTVKFQIADAKNTHTEDPERARGTVRALELTADGLDMIVDLTDDGAKLIGDNPDLPVSARIVEDLARADGQQFPVAIKHVLGTLDPRINGMSPWQAVDLANDPDIQTVDLSAAEYDTKEPAVSEPTLSVWQKIGKALGLADTATEDDVRAKLTDEKVIDPANDAGQLSAEDLAALEALANEPEPVALTAEVQAAIDLANSRAEQAITETAQLRVNAAKSAWQAERLERLHAGVPAALLDLAAPWCGGDAPAGFIDLANTATTVESVRDAAAADMRKILDAHKGLIDLSVIGESPHPDEDNAASEARQEAVRKHRQAAGI